MCEANKTQTRLTTLSNHINRYLSDTYLAMTMCEGMGKGGRNDAIGRQLLDSGNRIVIRPTEYRHGSAREGAACADQLAQVLNGGDGFERAAHDLPGPRALGVVCQARLEQLGIREDHAELIVQAVKHPRQVGRGGIERLPGWILEGVGHG